MSLRSSVFALAVLATASSSMGDFSGYYDPFSWGFDTSSNGFVDIGGAPAAITVAGPDDGSFEPGWTDFFIDVPADGTFSFDWFYDTDDDDGWDAGLYINNTLVFLSDQGGSFGSESMSVFTGDIIGFSVESLDSSNGRGYLTISNFNAPLVPEPTTLGAMAVLSALALRRRA